MATFLKRKILGLWREGFCLDLHTLSSQFIGYDEYAHPRFDTHRSPVGDLLYRLKSKGDLSAIPEIVECVERLMDVWNPPVDTLVPVPPSTQRAVQPVRLLAESISRRIGIPVANCVIRTREIPQLKNVFDLDERSQLLEGLHTIDAAQVSGKRILLFDDLYRSGATMNAITAALHGSGVIQDVYALTITRTRSSQ